MISADRPVALVTGASAGLGREFARQLSGLGYDLVLVARDGMRLEELAAELRELAGAESEILTADLTRDEDVARVVERIDQEPIHLLVNNAGFGVRGSIARSSREDQDAMVRVHVVAANRLAQAAVQTMVGRGRGVIINVSSISSFLTSPGSVNYTSTKAWQRVFTESLALELGISERVTFTGALPFEEVPRYLKAADAFTFASVTETQGLVTIEAMAAGLPVVAVDGPGTRDIVEHGKQGFLVENDPDALAQGLHRLLSDSQQRKRFSNNALKKARTFDIAQLGHELIRVYEQAIQDKRENQYVTLNTEETTSQEAASPAST